MTTTVPVVEKTNGAFRMSCAVSCNINASAEKVWQLLTDPDGFPRWNSTVTSLKGKIAIGETLELKVPLAPKRVFKPKVTKLEANQLMEWSDGMAPMFKGVRTYLLQPKSDGTIDFSMSEVFAGVMLPMIKGSLPDFGPAFETYAADLKRAAEGSK
jgi:hypothetical protein